ncbi:MAG: succinylglutamate desuccinylase/aspartoacylase family protein [Gemmatimonadaceae bacterium]|nr:succinylglutamate desuccinylase/aspartoacylase family protein [Gemmatimonadaceae bacterium]MCW5826904.1 succinylglutamate desuccinylase/aspartoacylase family protein [Gemmatimonadaceae bacterium]
MRLNTGCLRNGVATGTRERRFSFQAYTRLLAVWIVLAGAACTGTPEQRYPPAPALPVTAITGPAAGPTVAFVAGVHGGKVAAVHAVDSLRLLLPGRLRRGRVLLVAPANAAGFAAGLAQVSPDDSLNLNRVFPGNPDGRPTERLAARLLREVVAQADYLVDLHGSDGDEAVGAFAYAARPGLDPRVDSAARALAAVWATPTIVWDEGGPRDLAESRFLQTAAHLSGVPAITVFERGAAREDARATAAFVEGAQRVLASLGMLEEAAMPTATPATQAHAPTLLARRAVVTAAIDGTWRPATTPSESLRPGEPAGWLRSSSGVESAVRSPDGGLVLHLRRAGPVQAGIPLVITGLVAAP